jgi:hypothetical protein
MSKKKQNCGSCKWGRFLMTNHTPPRPRPHYTGECAYMVGRDALTRPPGLPSSIRVMFDQTFIRPEHGTACPCWEAK